MAAYLDEILRHPAPDEFPRPQILSREQSPTPILPGFHVRTLVRIFSRPAGAGGLYPHLHTPTPRVGNHHGLWMDPTAINCRGMNAISGPRDPYFQSSGLKALAHGRSARSAERARRVLLFAARVGSSPGGGGSGKLFANDCRANFEQLAAAREHVPPEVPI